MEIDDEVDEIEPKPLDTGTHRKKEERPPSFFHKFFGFLFGGGDPEYEKKRLLKEVTKALKQSRLKFYRSRNEIMEPGFAKYFFEIYKVLGPAQSLVKHADYSGVLKTIIIEKALSDANLELRENLTEVSIRKRAETLSLKDLGNQIKDELVSFFAAFESDKVKKIETTYQLLSVFVELIHFDYYFLLKKFDSSMPENNFFYTPHFEPINAEYIVEDLKEFQDIIFNVEEGEDWDNILDILKEYRGVDVVSRAAWKKNLARIRELNRSRVLFLMIQHIEKNPYYKIKPHVKTEKIVESYLSKLKAQTDLTLQKIYKEKHSSKVDELSDLIFGTKSVSRLKNYTEKANAVFSKKMLGGFSYVHPLNYLKAFLLDYLKKDIREVIDLFLIKGKWTSNIVSQQLSESFHILIDISEKITEFDDSISEEAPVGAKLKLYIHKFDKDKTAAQKVIRQMLKELNDIAKGLIHEAAQNLITIGKNLKLILEDHQRSSHELIINWKEIEVTTDKNLKEIMVIVYKKLYYIVKLLQVFIKED
jgi:hypothetical protein